MNAISYIKFKKKVLYLQITRTAIKDEGYFVWGMNVAKTLWVDSGATNIFYSVIVV